MSDETSLCGAIDPTTSARCTNLPGHIDRGVWHEGFDPHVGTSGEKVASWPEPDRAPLRTGPPGRASVATSVRFSPEIHDRVNAAARERGVSARWLIERLVSEGLDRLIPVDQIRWTTDT